MNRDLISYFSEINDPRNGNSQLHQLIDIIVIAIIATICGADSWVEIELFGKSKEEWFSTFLELPNGIPSHDTFGRVFSALSPAEFERCFIAWVQDIREMVSGEIVAIDGKTVRRSHDRMKKIKPIHLVSAWASKNRLVLGQQKVNEKSNEITAIPELLGLLQLKGCIVTIDAMGCQKEIAKKIVEEEADYVLAVKGNQKGLQENIEFFFESAKKPDFKEVDHDFHQTVDKDHGRLEIRRYWLAPLAPVAPADWLPSIGDWIGITQIGMVESERHLNGKVSVERRYYITSMSGSVKDFSEAVRCHWGIENSVHWVLDIAFREDDHRIRTKYSAENAAILRRIALNLLRQEKISKRSIRGKRLKAGWDLDYLKKILSIPSM